MKKLIVMLLLVLSGWSAVYADYSSFDEAAQAGTAKSEAGDSAGARKDFEAALALAHRPEDKAAVLINIGQTYLSESNGTKC